MCFGVLAEAAWAEEEYLIFEDDHLVAGRSIWLGTCENCHGIGVGGAPVPTEPPAWDARLQKPRETLYAHALEGFFGPRGTMMPPRGGNEALTDDEVRAAVDYMVALASAHSRRAKGENE